jgi:hypothetical protein
MKKLLLFTVIGVMLLAGCSSSEEPDDKKVYHVGSASVTSLATLDSNDDLAKDGFIEITTTYATVVLDSDKKFVFVSIDSAQNVGTFDGDGVVVTKEVVPTKKEKEFEYGMKDISPIKKEWFEQIEAFETYLIGKDLSAVTGLMVEEGYLSDSEDLKSSVTMAVSEFISVVEKAVANTIEVTDVVSAGVASTTKINATDAREDNTGKIEIEVTTASVALDSDDKIVYVNFDTAQNQGTYDDDGLVVESTVVPTKKEKGDDYGLIDVSSISKNWYEQVGALETWMVNKTVSEVKELPVTDDHISDGEDLKSSVTISVGVYQTAFDKAIGNITDISK